MCCFLTPEQKEKCKEKFAKIKKYLEENPWKATAITFLLGISVGILIGKVK